MGWEAPSDVELYNWAIYPTQEPEQRLEGETEGTKHEFYNLLAATDYTFEIVAVNALGESKQVSSYQFTTIS
jgi:hypothetical protein